MIGSQRGKSPALLLLLLVVTPTISLSADTADFVVWSAYNVTFDSETSKIYFLASVYVLNLTNQEFRDLTFTARPPETFKLEPPPAEIHVAMRRPDDFSEEMKDGAYTMRQKFLGAGQATTLFYRVKFTGRPMKVEFPGLQIEYRAKDSVKSFEAVSEVHDLTNHGKFTGGINDYVRRYAGFSLPLTSRKGEAIDWSFSALDYRASGSNPLGIIEISGSPEGEGAFRVQAGFPGDFREMLVRWEPRKRGRKDPITEELVTKELGRAIKALGDFEVDSASLQWSEGKVARLPTVIVDGKWVDRKKARLGGGPFRMYALNDNRNHRDLFFYIGVQARGVGPGLAEVEQPEKAAALLESLAAIITSLRL